MKSPLFESFAGAPPSFVVTATMAILKTGEMKFVITAPQADKNSSQLSRCGPVTDYPNSILHCINKLAAVYGHWPDVIGAPDPAQRPSEEDANTAPEVTETQTLPTWQR